MRSFKMKREIIDGIVYVTINEEEFESIFSDSVCELDIDNTDISKPLTHKLFYKEIKNDSGK